MQNSQDRRWYFWLAVVIVVLTTLPYLVGFSKQTDSLRFSGSFIGVEDQNSYIAKMRSGYDGEWLFRTPYTAILQNGILTYFPYILIGKLAGGKELYGQFQFLFQILRIGSIFLYVFSLMKFFSRFIHKRLPLRAAVLLCIFGGGLGWLYFVGLHGLWQNRLPLEFYSPDAFSFLSILILPHIIFARSFMLLSLDAWIFKQSLHVGKLEIRYPFLCALFGYFVYLFQPINFSILLLINFFFILYNLLKSLRPKDGIKLGQWVSDQRIILLNVFILFLLYLPLVGYNFYIMFFDPFVRTWSQQNILTSPPITDYLLAYLVWIAIGLVGFPKKSDLRNHSYLFWGLWIIAGFGMVYLPITIQRRYIEGIWVVIILLAIKGIERIGDLEKHRNLLRGGLILGSLSSLILLIGCFIQVSTAKSPVYVEKDRITLFQYLDSQFTTDDIVFASHELSNQIPAWTHVNTIVGHGPESIGERAILDEYQKTMDGQYPADKFIEFLAQKKVSAFIVDQQTIEKFPECLEIYKNDSYIVCQVGQNE
jgi:hypothetical protein